MKKIITTAAIVIAAINSFAQSNNSNSVLIRHDTTLLKASECEWIIKSLTKNNAALTAEIGKSVPAIILDAIKNGRLKATDYITNKPIPGREIYSWHMPADTIKMYDNNGNTKDTVIQHLRDAENILQIKIYCDWYFDIATGKFESEIKWIEPMEGIYTSFGAFIGEAVFCRIYY